MTDEPVKKRRKKGVTPTARALKECRKRGWIAQVVERRIPGQFVTIDLFGCIDIVAMTPHGFVGIQATSGTNHASRVNKIHAEPRARTWIQQGARLEVWSWAQHVGGRKKFDMRVERIMLADFPVAEAAA